jgi:hypothetical protein
LRQFPIVFQEDSHATDLDPVALGLVPIPSSDARPGASDPEVTLTRFDCGTPQAPTEVNLRFSDTYAYGDLKVQLTFSCYLVKHGEEYLLWDTGHSMSAPNVAPKVSLWISWRS